MDDEPGTEERKVSVAKRVGAERELTPAQQRVFELIVSGASCTEIASETGTSRHTARNHIAAVMDKLERVVRERTLRAIETWVLDQALYEAITPPKQTKP